MSPTHISIDNRAGQEPLFSLLLQWGVSMGDSTPQPPLHYHPCVVPFDCTRECSKTGRSLFFFFYPEIPDLTATELKSQINMPNEALNSRMFLHTDNPEVYSSSFVVGGKQTRQSHNKGLTVPRLHLPLAPKSSAPFPPSLTQSLHTMAD